MFGFIGKLAALPIRIVSAPIKAIEAVAGDEHECVSSIVDDAADAVERAIAGQETDK